MVHGQIILNQFKNFPKKSVANSAFVSGLRAKMELRRHCKLYDVQRPKGSSRVSSFLFSAEVCMHQCFCVAHTSLRALCRKSCHAVLQLCYPS